MQSDSHLLPDTLPTALRGHDNVQNGAREIDTYTCMDRWMNRPSMRERNFKSAHVRIYVVPKFILVSPAWVSLMQAIEFSLPKL